MLQFLMRKRLSPIRPVKPTSTMQSVSRLSQDLAGEALADEEADFTRHIYLERRRAERSRRSLLLILLDGATIADPAARMAAFQTIIQKLASLLRDTDVLGWYRKETVLGVLLPDLERLDQTMIRSLFSKISDLLDQSLSPRLARRMQLTAHAFPDPLRLSGDATDFTLYPELPRPRRSRLETALKRALDFGISLLALLLLSPLLALLALAVKCSSRGPALFRQARLGLYAKPFTFLKFRSMYAGNNAGMHEAYVAKLIAGEPAAKRNGIYKMTDDPRVTTLGRILRRTSLDELPQLWNVLRGEMSLVGPRPPLGYEFRRYAPWHRRRVLEVKPGITGLWQVQGRSGISFDEMVRLDLRYARRWSLWLDLKILWQTPAAMLSGKGAY
ncbi:MAG TPA: sugar transferase [Terriglobales bacterium]|nr:sugar transferase [Terriglobales bacterium]